MPCAATDAGRQPCHRVRWQAQLKNSQAEAKEQARLASGGQTRALFPKGINWGGDELGSVPYVDPAWRGKSVSDVVALLVNDLLELHRQCVAADPSSGGGLQALNWQLVGNLPVEAHYEKSTSWGSSFELDEGSSGEEGREMTGLATQFVRGEVSTRREANGSSFSGVVRLRPELFGRQDRVMP